MALMACFFNCLLYVLKFSICLLIYLFFFFKQKTAYEMRISDWSSDVCSSDLVHYPRHFMAAVLSSEMDKTDSVVKFINETAAMGIKLQIGRASCRERVCQYV